MPAPVLTTSDLAKSYGRIKAIDGLDLNVKEGDVFGILGPNGSGKSTTLSIVLGILSADRGDFQWFGQPPSNESRKRIGSMLEQPNFYPYLSARKNLELSCRIKGGDPARIPVVLEQVGLLQREHSAFKTFSTGMKQRLAIASALMADPSVLVLDEPTNGLDPQGIAEVRELIIEVAKEGKTIILASHILDEVEKVCDHVAVIKQGKLLAQGAVEEIKLGNLLGGEDIGPVFMLDLAATDMEVLARAMKQYPGFVSIKADGSHLVAQINAEPDAAAVNGFLHARGITVNHLSLRTKRLEEAFLEITSES